MARKPEAEAQEPTIEDLNRQIEALRADLTGIAETLKSLGLAQGKSMADDLKARAQSARRAGERQFEEFQAQADDLIHEADRMVRNQPATAMGIAAGIGFLVGLLMARR